VSVPAPGVAAIARDLVVRPCHAFGQIREHPGTWWWPCTVVLACTTVFWIAYFATVDGAWLVDRTLAEMGRHVPPDVLRGLRGRMTTTALGCVTVATAVAGLGLRLTVVSVYLGLVARLSGDTRSRFAQWLALASWASLPEAAGIVGKAIEYVLAAGDRTDPGTLSTSFSRLSGFHPAHPLLVRLLDYDVAGAWTLALLVVGVRAYRRSGWVSAAAIVSWPWALAWAVRLLQASR
jgi:hypothetical protein